VVSGAPLVLASRSPQRRAILEQLGIEFEVLPANVPERDSGLPEEVVRENALAKARAVATTAGQDRTVLGVDTDVVLDGHIYGKASDEQAARAQIERLSGRVHEVWSGIALVSGSNERTATERTLVSFRALDPKLVDWYLASGEWRDRAGAYAIQGRGAALVDQIEGDYWNVVGLPMARLLDLAPELVT
jgi:septum formation protein